MGENKSEFISQDSKRRVMSYLVAITFLPRLQARSLPPPIPLFSCPVQKGFIHSLGNDCSLSYFARCSPPSTTSVLRSNRKNRAVVLHFSPHTKGPTLSTPQISRCVKEKLMCEMQPCGVESPELNASVIWVGIRGSYRTLKKS